MLRDFKLPRAIKYGVVAIMAGIWKWYYYAPNTYKQLKIQAPARHVPTLTLAPTLTLTLALALALALILTLALALVFNPGSDPHPNLTPTPDPAAGDEEARPRGAERGGHPLGLRAAHFLREGDPDILTLTLTLTLGFLL